MDEYLTPRQAAVYRVLVAASKVSTQVPSNVAIAEASGMPNADNVSDVLIALHRKEWIKYVRSSRERSITILATGATMTAATASSSRGKKRRPQHRMKQLTPEELAARKDADQERLHAARRAHLEAEQRRYGLRSKARDIYEMPA